MKYDSSISKVRLESVENEIKDMVDSYMNKIQDGINYTLVVRQIESHYSFDLDTMRLVKK